MVGNGTVGGNEMSEARKIADVRLAKGEITAEQHADIVAQLSSGDLGQEQPELLIPTVAAAPSSAGASPASGAKNQSSGDVQQLRNGAKAWAVIGVLLFAFWFFVFKVRSDWMESCISDPRVVEGSCHHTGVQNLIFFGLTLGWLASFGISLAVLIYAENQKQGK